MFSIFAQNGCRYQVEDEVEINAAVYFDDDEVIFSEKGRGVQLGIYENEARAAEVVDELVNSYYEGKTFYRLPRA